MIRINLLPTLGRQEDKSLNYILGIVFGIIILVLIVQCGYGYYQEYTVNCLLDKLRAERNSLQYYEQMLNLSKEKQVAFAKKNALIKTLNKEHKAWPAIITSLSNVTPKEVWFDEISIVADNTLKMAGHAVAYADVAKFLKTLEDGNILGEPVLLGSQLDESTRNTRKFEVTIKLKGI